MACRFSNIMTVFLYFERLVMFTELIRYRSWTVEELQGVLFEHSIVGDDSIFQASLHII